MAAEKPSFMRFGGGHNFSGGAEKGGTQVSVAANPGVTFGTAAAPSAEGVKGKVTAKVFEWVISVSLVAMFFGLPLFFTGTTYQGLAFEKQMYFYFWLLVGIVAWVSKGVVTGEMRLRRTPIDLPLLAFLAFYVISASLSVDRWHSFWGFFGDPSRGVISVIALALAFYFLMSHFTLKRFYWMFGAFLLSGTLVLLWSFLATLKIRFLPSAFEQYAPLSLIGTLSTLTTFVGLMIPLFITALFLLWSPAAKLRKLTRNILSGTFLVGLLLALYLLLALAPYVTWAVVLGGMSFFLIYVLAQIMRPNEQWTWVPMLVFVVLLSFLMIGKVNLVKAQLPVEVTPNLSLSWSVAKEALKENFIMGVGPANYGYAFSMFHPEEYNDNPLYTLRFYQGTGLFFESLPTLGALGTILLLVLWFSFLSVGLYLLSHEKQRNKVLSLGLWTVSVMLFIAAFMAAINGTLLILGVLLSALALAALMAESGSEEKYVQLSLKASPKYALALAFIFMLVSAGVAFLFVFVGKAFVADISAGKAIRLSAAGSQKEAVAFLNKATATYPQEGRYLTRTGQELMALANAEASKAESERDVDALVRYVQGAVAMADQGKGRMPNDVLAVESLALIFENGALYASDALPKALENYERARELEPKNPLLALKIGQVKRAQADAKPDGEEKTKLFQEAQAAFEESKALKKNLPAAYYNLAVVQARQKDLSSAVENAVQAVNLDKNNLNFRYNLAVLYQLRNESGDKAKAEALFKDILKQNEKLIDVRLSLGLLYEGEGKKNDALGEYEKILSFLPADAEGNVKSTREQVQKLIDNVKSGRGNLPQKNAATEPVGQPGDIVAPVALPAPTQPNESPVSEVSNPLP